MKYRSFVFAVLAIGLVAGCQQDTADVAGSDEDLTIPTASVTGTVTYRERMALSPDAVVEVNLQDISRADAPAILLARQEISGPGQVPVRFELEYAPADIDERMTYAVSARITDHGELMFVSDTIAPVLTRGAGNNVELVLVRVNRGADAAAHAADAPQGFPLQGMFRYMADAALFRDCRDGKTWPVAMEGQYLELERAYLNSGIEPGSEIMASVQGRILERPSMEGNINEVKLIVDIFNNLLPDKTCTPSTSAELLGTYWKLFELGGNAVTTAEGMKEAHVILVSEDSRVKGFAGCNNFFGQFETADDTLTFSALGSTMMACPEGMDTEQGFLAALGATSHYRISGLILELYADEELLARLEAVYL